MPFYKVEQYVVAETIVEAKNKDEVSGMIDFHKYSDYEFHHVDVEEIEKPKDWDEE